MSNSNIMLLLFLVVALAVSTAFFSMKAEKLKEQLEVKDSKILELHTKNADYNRVHKWIPILNQLLTPLARAELNALSEKLDQQNNSVKKQ